MAFNEPEDSLRPLHKPAIDPYVQQDLTNLQVRILLPQVHLILSSHLHLGPLKGLFSLGFPIKTLYAFMDCSIRAICPAQLSHFDKIPNYVR